MCFKRIVNIYADDLAAMTPYERWRVLLQVIHIVITLGVPFVAVAVNFYFRG